MIVEIYTFKYGGVHWRYTSSDSDITSANITYSPLPIDRGVIGYDDNGRLDEITIEVPYDTPFLELFRVSPPSRVFEIVIEEYNTVLDSTKMLFSGRMSNVKWSTSTVELLFRSGLISTDRFGLRRHYQYLCPHMLYSTQCGASKSSFKIAGTVGSVTGTQVNSSSLAAYPTDHFAGGYIEYTHPVYGTKETVAVMSSNGSQAVLFSAPVGLSAGDSVSFYPGCKRTLSDCADKFSNSENYGGMPFMPTKNPFSGDPIF